ncbi:hypothetical protein [Kitasatospora purpeofusca]|uniref:hypothetical protein n=1 Tax=Kitasatospora purpeofusca TaxID=67352 RepID=UPI0036526976
MAAKPTAPAEAPASQPESTSTVVEETAATVAPAAPSADDAALPPSAVEQAPEPKAPAGPERVSLVGFEVGRPAPTDAYQSLHSDGGVTGPAVTTHPGGGAVQIVTAGTTVTEGVMRALTAADALPED